MYAHEEDQLRLDYLVPPRLKEQSHPGHIHQQRNAADGGAVFVAEQAAHGEDFAIFHGDGGADVADGDDRIGQPATSGRGKAGDGGYFGIELKTSGIAGDLVKLHGQLDADALELRRRAQ